MSTTGTSAAHRRSWLTRAVIRRLRRCTLAYCSMHNGLALQDKKDEMKVSSVRRVVNDLRK